MAADPVTLDYPEATPDTQLSGGQSFDGTTNTWVPQTAAVVLTDPEDATRDPGNQYECQLADGTDQGFTDTTYALTASQIAAGSLMGA